MPRTRKLLLTTLVVGATSAVAGLGVFAAFTAVTENTGNSITAGTVDIDDVDEGVALYTLNNMGPGSQTQRCTRVRYLGSLPATVKLYRSNTVTNGTAFNLQIERGSGLNPAQNAMPSCNGFVAASGGTIFTGTLNALPTSYLTAPDARSAPWSQSDTVDYRFTITVVDDPTPGAHKTPISSGQHSFTWEARNN